MENPAQFKALMLKRPFFALTSMGQITLELLWVVVFFLSFVTAVYWLWDESHRQLGSHQFPTENTSRSPTWK